jgi:hypothetical protein
LGPPGQAAASNNKLTTSTSELPPPPPLGGEALPGTTSGIPQEFGVDQNYPNPFNPVTTIHYTLPVSVRVNLTVYNMLGQVVAILVDEVEEAGYKSVVFKAVTLPSGLYFYRFNAGTFSDSKKMMLVK